MPTNDKTLELRVTKTEYEWLQKSNRTKMLVKAVKKHIINLLCDVTTSALIDFSKVTDFVPRHYDKVRVISTDKSDRATEFELDKIELVYSGVNKKQTFRITLGDTLS